MQTGRRSWRIAMPLVGAIVAASIAAASIAAVPAFAQGSEDRANSRVPGDQMQIGGMTVVPSFMYIPDREGDFVDAAGRAVEGVDSGMDVVEAWFGTGTMTPAFNRWLKEMHPPGAPYTWNGTKLKNGDEIAVNAIRFAGPVSVEAGTDFQLWGAYDAKDGIVAKAGSSADFAAGSKTVHRGGRFATPDGDRYSREAVKAKLIGQLRRAGQASSSKPRLAPGVGWLDTEMQMMFDIGPVSKGATSYAGAIATTTPTGVALDRYGTPTERSRIPVAQDAEAIPYLCLSVAVEPGPAGEDPSVTVDLVLSSLEYTLLTQAEVAELANGILQSSKKKGKKGAKPIDWKADTWTAGGPGSDQVVHGINLRAQVPAGRYSIDTSSPLGFGPWMRPVPALFESGMPGNVFGDDGCGRWHLPDDVCEYLKSATEILQSMFDLGIAETRSVVASDDSLLCLAFKAGYDEPIAVLGVETRVKQAGSHFSDPLPPTCKRHREHREGGDLLLDCGDGSITSLVRQLEVGDPSTIVVDEEAVREFNARLRIYLDFIEAGMTFDATPADIEAMLDRIEEIMVLEAMLSFGPYY